MAFVLVAIFIFFGIVAMIYLSFQMRSFQDIQNTLAQDEAKELAYKFASTPEFAYTSGYSCSNCIDLDKVLVLKGMSSYTGFWSQLDYIEIEKIYPPGFTGECTIANYPNCRTIKILNSSSMTGIPQSAFVTLVHFEPSNGGYPVFELGRIHVKPKQQE